MYCENDDADSDTEYYDEESLDLHFKDNRVEFDIYVDKDEIFDLKDLLDGKKNYIEIESTRLPNTDISLYRRDGKLFLDYRIQTNNIIINIDKFTDELGQYVYNFINSKTSLTETLNSFKL